ncbi:hypothetical protein Hypma_004494 [Hypsizygus marmoreus]|uniref:Uncharacterized protein n=1 Tax=Hypsizygus marmoreus TaxID=39966 RepID=A0A369K616_HYPMA|nr:hypothetical protein Hypma_004494 [Hypsizygus marmoreus]
MALVNAYDDDKHVFTGLKLHSQFNSAIAQMSRDIPRLDSSLCQNQELWTHYGHSNHLRTRTDTQEASTFIHTASQC